MPASEKRKGTVAIEDIHVIVSQSEKLLSMLKSDPALKTLCEIKYANRMTTKERENLHAGQLFIIVDFVDADPGNAPWGAYKQLKDAALSRGARASILAAWSNKEAVLNDIKDWVMSELSCAITVS